MTQDSGRPQVIAIIPARMGSSRFPGKPLIPILGLPMIEHVRRRVERVAEVDVTVVATCDPEIRDVVEAAGGRVIMTSPRHERATDRIEEAARLIPGIGPRDIVINVQGDEPMVSAVSLKEVIAPFFADPSVNCSCLVYPILDTRELTDLNIVKTALSRSGRILYLSRAAIPGKEVQSGFGYTKQSGIMAYRAEFLRQYTRMEPTPLEAKESVDILRILENDLWVQGVLSREETKGVDVPAQVAQLEQAILSDPRQKRLFEEIRGAKP